LVVALVSASIPRLRRLYVEEDIELEEDETSLQRALDASG
jgi:hypothetical protein